LAAILEHSPEARLIIVDNGSSRDTELMLEEFSEPLGDQGLFIKSERNIGLVPAINMGLSRSDSDFAVIVRPHVMVVAGWLSTLLEDAETSHAGILTPVFTGKNPPLQFRPVSGCTLAECCTVTFSVLMLRGEMRIMTGNFDESLDGGEWCLKEYVRRAVDKGYRTFITSRSQVSCGKEACFGSPERRSEYTNNSRKVYQERWGSARHYVLYFGKGTEAITLDGLMEQLMDGARQGHRFTLLLHRRQYADFRRMGWNGLHAGIELCGISMLFPERDLLKKLAQLRQQSPEIVTVRGNDGVIFPGADSAIPVGKLLEVISERTTNSYLRCKEELQ
jgi:hypothetical protein